MEKILAENIITNSTLKNELVDIVSNVYGQELENKLLEVLIVPKPGDESKPIEKDVYYSAEYTMDADSQINSIKSGRESLVNMEAESRILHVESKRGNDLLYTIFVLLLYKAVNYSELIQYVLSEIGREAEYKELGSKERIARVIQKCNLKNREILMIKYSQDFLERNKLPTAERLIELSTQRYEGSESEARIYFENENMKDIRKMFVFGKGNQKVKATRMLVSGELRTIRKLMEMSKRKALYLFADKELCITALVTVIQDNPAQQQEVVPQQYNYICFEGYMRWSVYIKGKEKICYRQGKYYINSSDGQDKGTEAVRDFKARAANKIGDKTIKIIGGLVETLKKQKHGTSVILTDDVNEVTRLCNLYRGILINRSRQGSLRTKEGMFDEEKLLSITDIDGALFMDLDGKCSAFGVIVDGIATEKGNPGKGARYNSIHNYIRQKKNDKVYIALIFSEDGDIVIEDNLDVIE